MAEDLISTETTRNVTAHAGGDPKNGKGIEIRFRVNGEDADASKMPCTVSLRFFQVDGVVDVEIEPELLERAGRLMETARHRVLGDARTVCAEHGYHSDWRCPACEAAKVKPAASADAAPAPF